MSSTYTYVALAGSKILSRGYHANGERFNRKDDFYPTLFINSKKTAKQNTEWKDLYGNPLYEIQPGSIRECKDFIERYKEVHGFEIFGMLNWITQYISEEFSGEIKLNIKHTRVATLDIETAVEDGFPDIEKANEEVLLITVYDSILGRYLVYTTRDFNRDSELLKKYGVDPSTVQISKHTDEYHMLKTFVTDWQTSCPDVVTGWNSQFFDIPYLVNRINRVIGDSFADNLSPWGMVRSRMVKINNDEQMVYDIIGVNQLDYIDLMKKYTYGGRESWKLDNVAFDELGKRKLEYDGTFKEHYTNDWDHFCMYNIIDVNLVKGLDDKMKLIELALTIAYDSKIVPDEVFSQIRAWDSLIYNELKGKKIVIPNSRRNQRDQFEGAYVKDPIIGKHKWVVSFDLQSLYPHLMMWANISPETIAEYRKDVTVDKLLSKSVDNSDIHEQNLSMTANGVCFTKEKNGFIVDIVTRIYNERSIFKKQMLKIEQEYANTKDENLTSEISRLNNLQLARKIQINSVYGAMGSPYFRYYDLRMAEGITTSGQLAIRWVSKALNEFLNKACKTKDIDYCIYNDTDSCYFTLAKVVEQTQGDKSTDDIVKFIDKFAGEVLQKVINKSYQELADYMNAYQQKLIMKREVIADVAVFVAKKRYAMSVHNSEGVQYKEPKIKVTGLELVRSSTPAVVRTTLKAGVKQVLYGTQATVQKFIADYQAQYNKEPIEAIAFPRGVNGLKQYSGSPIYTKGCPIHVRGALLYNHYIKKLGLEGKYEYIKEGSKMKFVYLKLPNKMHENIIGFIDKLPVEFGLTDYVDRATMFEKSFVDSMQTMLDPLGWSAEERSSLEDFSVERNTMSLMDKLKKNSTIKETAILAESKFFEEGDKVSTPVPAINVALSGELDGGFGSGLIVFAGPSKHFKTSFTLLMMKAYLDKHKDAIALFYDSEFGSPQSYFESFGIDLKRVLHTPVANIEELKFDIMQQLKEIKRGDKVFIALDSAGNIASKKEVDDALEGKSVADMSRAKQLKSLFRMVTPELTIKQLPMVVVNHTYKEQGLYPKDIVSGGTGIYYSANTIFIIGRQQEKDGQEVTGYNFVINVEKSRFSREKSKIPVTVMHDAGISKWSGLLDMALDSGHVIKPSNGWYSRVNTETGEIEEKKFREKDTASSDFWGKVLMQQTFRSWVKNKYQVSNGAIMSDEDLENIMEEVLEG